MPQYLKLLLKERRECEAYVIGRISIYHSITMQGDDDEDIYATLGG